MAEGNGKVVFDGMRYYGKVKLGQLTCDAAKIEYDNGDIYEGEVKQGKKAGNGGTYTYLNGDVYSGTFKNDLKHGSDSTHFFKHPNVTYYGSYQNDQKSGKCKITFGKDGKQGTYTGMIDVDE